MKKVLPLLLLSSALSFQAFANLTISDGELAGIQTTQITGTGSIDDFGSNLSYKSLWLYGADITIATDKTLVLTSTSSGTGYLPVSSGAYAIVCQNGANKITIENGGGLHCKGASSIAINEYNASLELTIAEDAGDVYLGKVFCFNGKALTLNLHKENAFGRTATIGSANASTNTINVSEDQSLKFDFRSPSSKNYFNITNGAIISVETVSYVSSSKSWQCVFTFENELKDGGILFETNSMWDADSWDSENAIFTIDSAPNQTIKYKFVDANGDALTNLTYTAVEGGWLLTGVVAVPEPAEWAVIFGSLALGLAIYRKRK